jgi:capsular polysaccharide transport system permease protein
MPDTFDSPVNRGRAVLDARKEVLRSRGGDVDGDPRLREGAEDDELRLYGNEVDVRPRGTHPALQLPPLPQRQPKAYRGLWLSLLLCVVLPTALVAVYYYAFAAEQYVAQFKFAVMESSPVLPGIPPPATATSPTAASGGGGMAMMSGGASMMGGSSATLQNYVVTDYLLSRQAVDELQQRLNIRALYDSPLAEYDPWVRFDEKLPTERFVRYWNRMVTAAFDPMTGLAVVTVRAFTAKDALSIADAMVTLSEDLVNSIAKRPQLASVRFAEGEVRRAEERLRTARDALMEYRLKEGVIDPSGALTTNIAMVQALRTQLVQQQADLAALLSQQQNPNSPTAQTLRSRVAATKEQLTKIEKEVSSDRQGNRILTELVARYEQLDLERQYAQGSLVAAQQAFDQARANAVAQHLYLTPYVRPVLPESATYPKRAQSVVIAALAFLGIWIVGFMIVRSVRDHM